MDMPTNVSTTQIVAGAAIVITPLVWKVLGRLLHTHFTTKLTILNDIPHLGETRRAKKIQGTAVICGGSIAGLWAARVCADHFERVVVIEPEIWIAPNQGGDVQDPTVLQTREQGGLPSIVNKRTRVWQYYAGHAYQPPQLLAARKLFPNFDSEARAMGINIGSAELHVLLGGIPINAPAWSYPGGKLPETIIATRSSFETLLRKLVRGSPNCRNVEFIVGTVTGVVPSSTQPNRLEGVQVRIDGQKEAQTIPGELIIDCTGTTQGSFKWLPRAGYGSSTKSRKGQKNLTELRLDYEQRMKYSRLQFTLTPDMKAQLSAMLPPDLARGSDYLREGWESTGWLFVLNAIAEVDYKVAMAKKMERGDAIEIGFGGWGVENPPLRKDQMMEFMESVILVPGYQWPKYVIDIVRFLGEDHPGQDEPIVGVYPSPASSYIQYHLAPNLPSNFVAIGDAVMEVNPIFGQGCSKACFGAVTLSTLLARTQKGSLPDDFGKKFFKMQEGRIGGFWKQVKDQDYRFTTTKPIEGEEEVMEKMLQSGGGFMKEFRLSLIKLALLDKEVGHALWHVAQMLAPATNLFAPWLLARVAWAKLRGVV